MMEGGQAVPFFGMSQLKSLVQINCNGKLMDHGGATIWPDPLSGPCLGRKRDNEKSPGRG
jgi:hypothetical protein